MERLGGKRRVHKSTEMRLEHKGFDRTEERLTSEHK